MTNFTFSNLAARGNSIFLSTTSQYGNILFSNNSGLTWSEVGNFQTWTYSIAIQDDYLFVGVDNGVWRRLLSDFTITGVEPSNPDMLPAKAILNQNFPNPFNTLTTISFSIPKKSFVSLKVFDVLGREVGVLLYEELLAGTYSRQWDPEGFPGSVYFYRLQAGSFIETKKLVLLR